MPAEPYASSLEAYYGSMCVKRKPETSSSHLLSEVGDTLNLCNKKVCLFKDLGFFNDGEDGFFFYGWVVDNVFIIVLFTNVAVSLSAKNIKA